MSLKLKPLGDRLIVRALEEEEKTASGLVLPDTAKEKPQKGEDLLVLRESDVLAIVQA